MKAKTTKRLESLDILRGADLFLLVALGPIVTRCLWCAGDTESGWLAWAFNHVEWEGFSPWDIVMPLFLFMSGVSIPFSMARYKTGGNWRALALRLLKRFVLLWLLGMICQGNLLALDPGRIYLYSNTLQAIATGYVVAALFYVFMSARSQVMVAVALLLAYWGVMEFVSVDGCGGGNYMPGTNMAEWIDNAVLGRFRDSAQVIDGQVVVAPWYHYSWLLSSLGFIVTVMTGVFAGMIIRLATTDNRKALLMALIGVGMLVAAWLWSAWLPIIKRIWTSSMVLFSSGWCFLLMSLAYYWIDVKGHRKGLQWLKVYGQNSIAAYMLGEAVNFSSVSQSVFYGFEHVLGSWYPVVICVSNVAIVIGILWLMRRNNLFLKC